MPKREVVFDTASINARLSELNAKTEEPDFWNDQAKAQSVLKEKSSLEKKLNSYDDLKESFEDLKLTIELAEAEEDEELAGEAIEASKELNDRIETFLKTLA